MTVFAICKLSKQEDKKRSKALSAGEKEKKKKSKRKKLGTQVFVKKGET